MTLENTGFTQTDLAILLDSPDMGLGTTASTADQETLAAQAQVSDETRKKLREVKAAVKARPDEVGSGCYLVVVFKDQAGRRTFLDRLHLPQTEQYISARNPHGRCLERMNLELSPPVQIGFATSVVL